MLERKLFKFKVDITQQINEGMLLFFYRVGGVGGDS